jgi:hypothetical protein
MLWDMWLGFNDDEKEVIEEVTANKATKSDYNVKSKGSPSSTTPFSSSNTTSKKEKKLQLLLPLHNV